MAQVATVRLRSRDLEKDPAQASSVEVECPLCDPDSAKPVPPDKCPRCRGTGHITAALADVVTEIRASRMEHLIGDKQSRAA